MPAHCKSNVLRLSFQGPLFPRASRAVHWAGLLPCGTGDPFPASPSCLCPLCRTRRRRSVCYQARNRLLSTCVLGASVCFQCEYMGCVVLGFLAAVCLGRAGRLPAPKARSHRGRAPCHLRESALLLRSGHTHLEPCAGGAALCCQHGLDLERNSGTLSYRASPPRSLCWLRDSK